MLEYRIKMGKKENAFHVNMLRQYNERESMNNRLQIFRYVLLQYRQYFGGYRR